MEGAWSKASVGLRVSRVSRSGSVLAHIRIRSSLVLWTSLSASTTTIYFVNII